MLEDLPWTTSTQRIVRLLFLGSSIVREVSDHAVIENILRFMFLAILSSTIASSILSWSQWLNHLLTKHKRTYRKQ